MSAFEWVSLRKIISDWHRLGWVNITACTICATIFTLAMNLVIKSLEVECRSPLIRTGVQPSMRAYIDDLNESNSSVSGCRAIRQDFDKLILWVRLSFKPTKSRSVVSKKGKVDDKFNFILPRAMTPILTENPIKSKGKKFHCSLMDSEAISKANINFVIWLSMSDRGPGPVLDFGPERGPGKGTMADLGPLIRHLVSTRLPSGGRAAFLSPLSPMHGTRPSV